MFLIFLLVVGSAIVRGLDIKCGCFDLAIFGIDEKSKLGDMLLSPSFAFVRNIFFLGCVALLFKLQRSQDFKPS